MIGTQKMELTNGSVAEALTEYINRHLHKDVKVTKWTPNYSDPTTVHVEFEEVQGEAT